MLAGRDKFGNLHNGRNCISKRNKIPLIPHNTPKQPSKRSLAHYYICQM